MARRGKFGESASTSSYATDVLKRINQMNATGETAAPTGTTDGTAREKVAPPDYSGIDFTGMDPRQVKEAKKAVWSPEYAAQVKAEKARAKASRLPFSDEVIQSSGALSAVKAGITYEQALANLRKLTKVTNKVPLEGQGSVSAKTSKAYAALTPAQKEAQWAFEIIGGYGTNSSTQGGRNKETNKWETYQELMFRRLGLDPSTLKNYAGPEITTRMDPKLGPVQSIANPLNATQRARLQRLRGMGSLTKKQSAAIARLRAKKNAPTILP